MQYSLYAFIPFGVLLAVASVTAGIALWPGKSRRGVREAAPLAVSRRSTAEILYFPSQRENFPALRAAQLRRAADGS